MCDLAQANLVGSSIRFSPAALGTILAALREALDGVEGESPFGLHECLFAFRFLVVFRTNREALLLLDAYVFLMYFFSDPSCLALHMSARLLLVHETILIV
jgi:hypothetical protein